MKTISTGWQTFIGILVIFIAIEVAFFLYLDTDIDLSIILHGDIFFLWFIAALIILLVVSLLLVRRKLDSSIARRTVEKNAEMRRELTQNIAHELKTPVTGIQGFLETILETPDLPAETRQLFLERSYAQSLRLGALIRDLTTLNRMEDISRLEDIEEVDISAIVQLVAKETSIALEEKKMTFRNHLPDGIRLQGSPSFLYSIFRNLVDNAIAYAGEGTVITLYAIPDRCFWHFTFADNGVGVPPEDMGRLFERFYRVDKGRSRRMGGTGLGLAIVKNAVQYHGGQISVRSAEPGLCFDFSLEKTPGQPPCCNVGQIQCRKGHLPA
ncbi:MAG: hypothetical protein IJ721_02505 [Bacteroidales bacterium]|nr:hypothetical protein [Bacteroidales bacterium]